MTALEQLRRAHGLTREALASRAGLAVRTVAYIEREGRTPQRATARVLGEALGVAPDALISKPENDGGATTNGAPERKVRDEPSPDPTTS